MDTEQEVTETEVNAETVEQSVEQLAQDAIDAEASGETPEEQASEEAKEWEPSFKYKVKDDHFDMEDWVKPLVTSADVEEKLKVLFSKGHGIEDIKADRTSLREQKEQLNEQYTQVSTEYENMQQSLNVINGWVAENKFDNFFEALRIPEDKILQWAVEKFKYRELPEEQQRSIDYQRQQERRLEEMQYQNQSLQQQQESILVETRTNELNFALQNQEVVEVANMYNEKSGRENGFTEEVIATGQLYHAMYGQDLSAMEAVQKTVEKFKGILGTNQPINQSEGIQTPQPNQAIQVKEKPVIPNVRGGNSSPVKSSPTSIADLHKLREQAVARESGT